MAIIDDLAQKFDVRFRYSKLPEGVRSYLIGGVIMLNEDLISERANWAFCHELAHLLLGHSERLPVGEAEEILHENEANELAAKLLLPDDEFHPLTQLKLGELRETFPFASYEVIARRRLTFRPGLLTICDNYKVTARVAPDGWNVPFNLLPVEMQALETCQTTRQDSMFAENGMQVEATFIDEGRGVERVILFLECEETL